MIVPTMSIEQIITEAFGDLPALWNKMREPAKRLQRLSKVDKSCRGMEQVYSYRSHARNNWLVVMRASKKVISIACYVWYRGTDDRLRFARIQNDGVSYHFSAHMLEQYFERFNKEPVTLERMKEFVKENFDIGAEYALNANEVRCGIRHGYLIGHWEVDQHIAQITTFVDHGKLFNEQIEQMDRLDQQRYRSAHPIREFGHRSPLEKKKAA